MFKVLCFMVYGLGFRVSVERNNEYNECVKYNQWVIAEIKSLTNEFLGNVKVSYLPTVKKYFRTKTQPEGYEPPDKYRNSRLDCTQYNPPQRSNPKGPAEKAPTINLHSPVAPDLDQKSQGNGGRSIPGGDGETEKEKSNIKIHPKPEPSVSDSLASSLTHTNGDNTAKGQHTDLKAERTVSPNNAQDATGQPTETTDAKAQSTQQLPKPPSAASPEDSPVANVLDPRLYNFIIQLFCT
ncbi:hypothetical protein POVWA2_096980 [Plasmodium ovale wallikeri]|uniref:PIR Superfamily Protein n=1 Tax=Plasmodium ovale wallikeri TaxID=864142 RepID=A0A1A9ARX2_PLAOA|nr:hypothetical protein POVWA2_096980 [Plasmodium ovale wallikeri]